MNASRPEAEVEYSRGQGLSEGSESPLDGGSGGSGDVPVYVARMLAFAGAVALLVAEPLALIRVQTAARHRVVLTITAGSHHSLALVPIAVLVLLLAWALGRPAATRPAAAALIALGLVTLGIALLGDLPDVDRTGLVGRAATGIHNARAVAGPGLYIETLGAVLLLAGGLLALVPGRHLPVRRGDPTVRNGGRRSGS